MDNTLTEDTTGREEKALDFDFPRVAVYLTSSFYSVTATVYSELSVSFCSGLSTLH